MGRTVVANKPTARELLVLWVSTSGLSSKQIAKKLGINVNTVKTHLANSYTALGASNRAQAVAAAYEKGYFPMQEGSTAEAVSAIIDDTLLRLENLAASRRTPISEIRGALDELGCRDLAAWYLRYTTGAY